MTVKSMRALQGNGAGGTAHRSEIDAADTDQPDSEDFLDIVPVVILGAKAVHVNTSFNDAAATATIVLCFYDESDVLLGVSADLDFAADDDITVGGRNIGAGQKVENLMGAHQVRARVDAVSASDDVSVYIGFEDGFTR